MHAIEYAGQVLPEGHLKLPLTASGTPFLTVNRRHTA